MHDGAPPEKESLGQTFGNRVVGRQRTVVASKIQESNQSLDLNPLDSQHWGRLKRYRTKPKIVQELKASIVQRSESYRLLYGCTGT